jgi:hypothetical protein
MSTNVDIKINKLELASELAHNRLLKEFDKRIDIYIDTEDCLYYTEEAQEIFNELYDHYLTTIELTKTK